MDGVIFFLILAVGIFIGIVATIFIINWWWQR